MPGVTPGTRGIVLNDWASRDLGAKPGDSITLEYYVWKEEGRLANPVVQRNFIERVLAAAGRVLDREQFIEYQARVTEALAAHLANPA